MSLNIAVGIFNATTGFLTGTLRVTPEEIEMNVEPGEVWFEGIYDPEKHWYDGTGPAARPARVELPEAGVAPFDLILDGLSPGAAIAIANEAGDELVLTAAEGPLTLTDAGVYTIKVDEVFPHHSIFQHKITVTHA
ncbi:hypothetical protein [Palleronia sp.]|uniref:hypothetical protein n=1 Tax=Palleronia sp. TaxID=1940284 RepID=UPI0035C839A7